MAVAHREAALFEGVQGIAEAGIVDAQPLAQGGPGQGLLGVTQSGAHGLGERRRGCGATVEAQRERLLAAAGETDQEGIGRGCERCWTVSSKRPSERRTKKQAESVVESQIASSWDSRSVSTAGGSGLVG